jgi:hypothetical protein
MHVLAAPSLTAGVIPVQWNQHTSANIFSQSKSFGLIVAKEEPALSYMTLLPL